MGLQCQPSHLWGHVVASSMLNSVGTMDQQRSTKAFLSSGVRGISIIWIFPLDITHKLNCSLSQAQVNASECMSQRFFSQAWYSLPGFFQSHSTPDLSTQSTVPVRTNLTLSLLPISRSNGTSTPSGSKEGNSSSYQTARLARTTSTMASYS